MTAWMQSRLIFRWGITWGSVRYYDIEYDLFKDSYIANGISFVSATAESIAVHSCPAPPDHSEQNAENGDFGVHNGPPAAKRFRGYRGGKRRRGQGYPA